MIATYLIITAIIMLGFALVMYIIFTIQDRNDSNKPTDEEIALTLRLHDNLYAIKERTR